MIEFHSQDVPLPQFHVDDFITALNKLILNESFLVGDINIIVCSDDYLLKMNKEYLNHDYYTDIITFDYCEDKLVSGDLFISIDRVQENSVLNNVSFTTEFARVCAHGVLHLCTYKDKTDEDEKLMRSKEDFYLPFFNVSRET